MEATSDTKKRNGLLKSLLLILGVFFFSFGLTSCTSTDKTEAYIQTGYLESSVEYVESDNRSDVTWSAPFQNNTIYTIDSIQITFDLYLGETHVDEYTYEFSYELEPGKTRNSYHHFSYEGKIDSIQYKSWHAEYKNLWDTYKPWWISIIIAAPVLALIFVLVMVIGDFDFEDLIDSVGFYIFDGVLIFGSTGITFLTNMDNWFPVVIILIGIAGFAVLSLLGLFIRFIFEEADIEFPLFERISDFFESKREAREDKKFEKEYVLIKSEIEGTEGEMAKLRKIKKDKLIAYCDNEGLRPQSDLKADLMDCISVYLTEGKPEEEERAKQSSGKKKGTKKSGGITFADIAGLDSAKEAFREKVILPFQHPELFEKYGKKAGGGILLYGLPGTGKTMFAEACSNEIDAAFFPVKCSDIKSKWYGESEQNVKQIFAKARKAGKAIIFFDEFEAIGAKRTEKSDNGNNDLVPEILAEMQGVGSSSSKSTIMVIAATNKPWSIDSAFLRPGRFDEKIYIPLPDHEAREKLFELKLSKVPTKGLDYGKMADMTDGFNGADIGEFAEKLKMEAINKSLASGAEEPITMDMVEKVSKEVKSSVSQEDMEMLEEFEEDNR